MFHGFTWFGVPLEIYLRVGEVTFILIIIGLLIRSMCQLRNVSKSLKEMLKGGRRHDRNGSGNLK